PDTSLTLGNGKNPCTAEASTFPAKTQFTSGLLKSARLKSARKGSPFRVPLILLNRNSALRSSASFVLLKDPLRLADSILERYSGWEIVASLTPAETSTAGRISCEIGPERLPLKHTSPRLLYCSRGEATPEGRRDKSV